MQDNGILYKGDIETFSKRHWKLLWPHILIPGLSLFLPLLNVNGNIFIYMLWDGIMLALIATMYASTRKWALTRIKTVAFQNDTYKVEVVVRDVANVFVIPKDHLKVSLQWEGHRPPVLLLSFYDQRQHLFDVYSGGKKELEEALDAIAYRIRTTQPAATSC